MAKEYYSLVTKVGQAKIANASVYGTKVDIKTIKLGDGNGSEYNPEEAQTDLKRVVYTGGVGAVRIDPERGNTIIIESIIPQEIGGFTIREIGYYDSAGDLIVIAKYKSQYKPVIGSGATVDMKVNTLIAVSNVDNVELKIDNTLIFATKKEVDLLNEKIKNIELVDNKIVITDEKGKFYSTTLDKVLEELDDAIKVAKNKADNANNKVNNLELVANKVTYSDITTSLGATTVQQAIEKLDAKYSSKYNDINNAIGQATASLNSINNSIASDLGNIW